MQGTRGLRITAVAPIALLLACGHGASHNVTLPSESVVSFTIDAGEAHAAVAQAEFERSAEILAKFATVGDVTCHTDADCAVTTKRDCCECCPRRAIATSKKWLEWNAQQCAVEKCAGCDESCRPEAGATAVCRAGRCALAQ